MTCPASVTVTPTYVNKDIDIICNTPVTYAAVSAKSNCAGTVTIKQTAGLTSGSSFPAGSTTNTFSATDAVGNTSSCTFTVFFNNGGQPKLECPDKITVNNVQGTCAAPVSFKISATDPCTAVPTLTQITGLPNGASFPVGITTETFKAVNASLNGTTCTFTVTVKDNDPPTIAKLSDITTTPNAPGCKAAITLPTPVTSDNCGVKSVANDAPALFPVGNTTVHWTVTDVNGNTANTDQHVTVNAFAPPVINGGNNSVKLCISASATLSVVNTAGGTVTWTSSNPGAVTVSASGAVKAVAKGSADITYTAVIHDCVLVATVRVEVPDHCDTDSNLSQASLFEAQSENNRIRLDVTGSGASDPDYFDVRKLNVSSGAFETLDIVNGKSVGGQANRFNKWFTVYDNAPDEGDNYYQVQTAFNDGTKTLSEVKKVNFTSIKGFSVFPNPTGDYLNVNLKDYSGKDVTLYFYNQIGVLQTVRHLQNVTNATPESIDVSDWTTGQYLIRAQSKGIRDAIQKVMVQK